jgi:hypothetical protein
MGDKTGFNVSASVLASAALMGSAAQGTELATVDTGIDPLFSIQSVEVCAETGGNCPPLRLVTLKQPENVIYTTRADIATPVPPSDAARFKDPSQASASDTTNPQADAERSE